MCVPDRGRQCHACGDDACVATVLPAQLRSGWRVHRQMGRYLDSALRRDPETAASGALVLDLHRHGVEIQQLVHHGELAFEESFLGCEDQCGTQGAPCRLQRLSACSPCSSAAVQIFGHSSHPTAPMTVLSTPRAHTTAARATTAAL